MKHSELIDIFDWFQRVAWRSESDEKIGVVLGGCGVYDGSEIHEAVITLLAIARNGAQAVCFAPDKPQRDVINHLTGEAMPEQRNVLVEAARIARGDILPLAQARAETLEALIVPGGFGAAKKSKQLRRRGPRMPGGSRSAGPGADDASGRQAAGLYVHCPGDAAEDLCVSAADDHWDRS